MDTIVASVALGISIAGALITFGITYGIVKAKQEFTSSEINELKNEVKELRHELEKFRRACAAICKLSPGRSTITDSGGEIPIVKD